jgi:hypothetical protein
MMSTGNYDENMLLSLPAALGGLGGGGDNNNNNDNFMPLTTQNYSERYKELEKILAEEKKNNQTTQHFYKVLKTDHTR